MIETEIKDTSQAVYVPEELIPEKGSKDVGPAVGQILSEILAYREEEKIPQRCSRHYKMKRAKHWKYEGNELALLSANLVGTNHTKTVNKLTANNPTFELHADGDLGDEGEELLSKQKHTTTQWWTDTDQQMTYREFVHSGELYGTVGLHGYLDMTVNYPHGEVMFDVLDMLYMSMYPPECRQMRKAEAFLHWYPSTVREARRKFPHAASQIAGDMSLLDDIGDDRQKEHKTQDKASVSQVVISSLTKLISGEKPRGEVNESDKLFIIECWVKDYSEKDGQPVYPGNIRRIIVCNGGEVVLSDDYNPSINPDLPQETLVDNYFYSRFPYLYCQPAPDPSSPFGLSDFEQLEKLNMEVNKALSQFIMFKDKASRVKFVNPKDSGVTDDEFNNVDGIVRPTNHLVAGALGYIPPPAMGNDIPAAIGLCKDLFAEVAMSFSDVAQGQKQGTDVVAAKAIALLLEQESRMAQGKSQSYSKAVREMGRMFLGLAQMWGDKPRYITFSKKGQDVTEPVTSEQLRIPSKLSVVNGSTMPVSDIYRREEITGLFKIGLVDQEEALTVLDIANAKEIIARMQAGPLGQFLQKLGMTGVPKQMLGMFEQIGKMDEKEIERALKEGKIPPFQKILDQMMQQMSQQPPPPDPAQIEMQREQQKLQIEGAKAQAEIKKSEAEAQKIFADIELMKQKIESEITDRQLRIQEGQIKLAGVEFDKENIKIQKAKAISDIKAQSKAMNTNHLKVAGDIADKIKTHDMADRQDPGPYDEKGMKSNNQEI